MERDGAVTERMLEILCEVAGDDEVGRDLDVPLFTSGLLDSLAVVRLLVAFEEAFGLVISPAELDREQWSTPRALIADIEARLARTESAGGLR
jgi:D-alanine--poly(phosphoribitol) ligase subunit 2